jgi:hypothetical protein
VSKKPKMKALSMADVLSVLGSRSLYVAGGVNKRELTKRYNEHLRCGDDPIAQLLVSKMVVAATTYHDRHECG